MDLTIDRAPAFPRLAALRAPRPCPDQVLKVPIQWEQNKKVRRQRPGAACSSRLKVIASPARLKPLGGQDRYCPPPTTLGCVSHGAALGRLRQPRELVWTSATPTPSVMTCVQPR